MPGEPFQTTAPRLGDTLIAEPPLFLRNPNRALKARDKTATASVSDFLPAASIRPLRSTSTCENTGIISCT